LPEVETGAPDAEFVVAARPRVSNAEAVSARADVRVVATVPPIGI
jgi:hypothetical protein